MTWKPKLTPAKLKALAFLDVAAPKPGQRINGVRCRGTILTSCYPLERMGLAVLVAGYDVYGITPAGRHALHDPKSFKPFEV